MMLVLLTILLILGKTSANEHDGICDDTDIRNDVTNFDSLENCVVIEGFLQILLIDTAEPKNYANLSFPKLREISDFLFLYRVTGLRSLRTLFPNLSVIRGRRLLDNYALVIYEMMSLEEIGLVSLTDILRGSIHIARNPHLCYVNTVDWNLIVKNSITNYYVKQNGDNYECLDQCQLNCPNVNGTTLCWNQNHCQKVCDPKCGTKSCSTLDNCCSELCLGGCTGKTSSDCLVCAGELYENKCSKHCPPSTYKYADRRCLTEHECRKLRVWDAPGIAWKVFQDEDKEECLQECPSGFIEDGDDKHLCKKCAGKCPKICPSSTVNSVATAQELRGCTRINGYLKIQIGGGENIVRELEENLHAIEEVDDYVQIFRSDFLISLTFLRNLKKINGNKKDRSYALSVFYNKNLQELFHVGESSHKLEIVSGKLYFHWNPKLCLWKIDKLKNDNNLTDMDDSDISPATNGDQAPCSLIKINITLAKRTARNITIEWIDVRIDMNDYRELHGYVISYQETLYTNLTTFDGRDGCSANTWTDIDVIPSKPPTSHTDDYPVEDYTIEDLKPYTQYAIHITSYTTDYKDLARQSDILYISTLPDDPSKPRDLKVIPLSPFELELTWSPPMNPNGVVTHYIIKGTLEKDAQERLNNRNSCKQVLVETPPPKQKLTTPPPSTDIASKCQPSKEVVNLQKAAQEAKFESQFEDKVLNYVFNKKDPEEPRRRKRSTLVNSSDESTLTHEPGQSQASDDIEPQGFNETSDDSEPQGFNETSNDTTIVIGSLNHFSTYYIEVSACHNWTNRTKLCSLKSSTIARTAALPFADEINETTISVRVQNHSLGIVLVKWNEPENPNGVIVTFELEYKRMIIENYKPAMVCITHTQYREMKGYKLTKLGPGNHSLRLRARSLAGYSNWTTPVYFVIEVKSEILNRSTVAVIITVSVIVFTALLGYFLWLIIRLRYKKNITEKLLNISVNPEYITTSDVYTPDEWEVPREKVTLLEELGQGSFGMVYSGVVRDVVKGVDEVKCAVKTVNENASVRDRIEFLSEASIMKEFVSYHVVKLLGVVSIGQPTLVIMELMSNGDLKSFLRSMRTCDDNSNKISPTVNCILRMASEIADGMAYLSARKFVHRDLAARNCMVADDLTVKIGDFGMTRNIYETDYYRKKGRGLLPVRWMAPESLKDGIFTSCSDVWSYGIVLWEMATLALQPYQGLSNEQVFDYVLYGEVMERPEGCPDKLYDLMKNCWNQNPNLRPKFMDLVKTLLPYVRSRFASNSYYYCQNTDSNKISEVDENKVD